MSARRKAPKAVEAWAVAVSGYWFAGSRFLHDERIVGVFPSEGLALCAAREHVLYRKQKHGQDVIAEPIPVRIVPVASKRRG